MIGVMAFSLGLFGYILGGKQDVLYRYLENDNLTVLLNQTSFFRKANYHYQLGTRYHDSLSIIMIDLDHFKNVNDSNNHLMGSAVLKQVGKIIQQHLRETDVAARFGGDEFVICLPRTDLEQAQIVADRIRQIIAETEYNHKSHRCHVTASFGVCAELCNYESSAECY